ncbi:50S ribosomal protein L1 [bacterium]|jgi:large subunit ribosomal protein L1|nr:50S ribosomal protein L1 [bacterium]
MGSKRSKAYRQAVDQYEHKAQHGLNDAVDLVKKASFAKFDETINLDVALGVDPRHADQMVRGTVIPPHGTGKTIRIVAIVSPEKEEEAKEAGADTVGGEDLVNQISKGWLDFEVVVTTPDMMRFVGKLGKILGPRGLMPNPKVGTVTQNLGFAIKELRAGRLEYRVDKYGLVHLPVGKRSFKESQLVENIAVVMEALIKAKPASSKGIYLKSVTLSPTMGPGVRVETSALRTEVDTIRSSMGA